MGARKRGPAERMREGKASVEVGPRTVANAVHRKAEVYPNAKTRWIDPDAHSEVIHMTATYSTSTLVLERVSQ